MIKVKDKKVVVWTSNGLGDITMSFPVLNYLKRKGAHVTIVGIQTKYLEFLKKWGMIDNYIIFKYKENQSKLFWSKERFKIMWNVGMLKANTMIVINRQSFFNDSKFKDFFKVDNYIYVENNMHSNQSELNDIILRRYFNYNVKESDYYYCDRLLKSFDSFYPNVDYVAVHPFSKKPDTILKPKLVYSLLRNNNVNYIIGSLNDNPNTYKGDNIHNALSNDFWTSLFYIYHSKKFICGDGGPMHFSLALGKETWSYWKETRPAPERIIRKTNISKENILSVNHFEK
jgi:hypothetical protein